jgi:hypothetical protein
MIERILVALFFGVAGYAVGKLALGRYFRPKVYITTTLVLHAIFAVVSLLVTN